jgi:hypothetical protein
MGTHNATWEVRGYAGQGNVAQLIDTLHSRTVIVCGNAVSVFHDLERAMKQTKDPVIFAVNDIGMYLPKLDHWVSLHADYLGAWKTVRWNHATRGETTRYHTYEAKPFSDFHWQNLTPVMALSGYFAMQIAWIMGAERIILAGCPGMQMRRFFEAESTGNHYGNGNNGSDKGILEQLTREMARVPAFKKAVRSMSGWTNRYFGGI